MDYLKKKKIKKKDEPIKLKSNKIIKTNLFLL